MSIRATCTSLAIALTAATLPCSGYEPIHSVGRHYGHGWSDGYHSRAACPPKRESLPCSHRQQSLHSPAPSAKSIPWWMIPADGAEPLPQPAAKEPVTRRAAPSSGPSLFRQPGEGSITGPTLMR